MLDIKPIQILAPFLALCLWSGCSGLERKSSSAREMRIGEYEKAYPGSSPGRLELMRQGHIFRGMTKAQFQAVAGWTPDEEVTLEVKPRHTTSLRYRTQGDELGTTKDVFVFINSKLYKWEIKSFEPADPEAPSIPHEYAGQ